MPTKITATFNDGDESTTRTLTLPHDVSDRIGELIGLGLLAELNSPDVFKNPAELDIAVHHERGVSASQIDPPLFNFAEAVRLEVVAQQARSRADAAVHHASPMAALAVRRDALVQLSTACDYAVGDTVEVIYRPTGHGYGPPVGHRAAVVEISDFSTLCIPWNVEEFDGFWLSYDQVRRVDEPAPSPSTWSAPTVEPDGTKTFTAPGVTMVEHPPTAEDGFPSWTITAASVDEENEYVRLRWRDVLRDSVEMLSRCRRKSGQQTAHEIDALIDRCREALEDA